MKLESEHQCTLDNCLASANTQSWQLVCFSIGVTALALKQAAHTCSLLGQLVTVEHVSAKTTPLPLQCCTDLLLHAQFCHQC